MDIGKVLSFNSASLNITPSQNRSQFGLRMANPLNQDTVSFSGTKKSLSNEEKKGGVNLGTAKQIHEEAMEMQPSVREFAMKTWGRFLVTTMNPNNPVLKICDRCKSPLSIQEKSQCRDLKSKQEVFDKMTDLNGMKIVMRDANKYVVDRVLKELITPIQKGEVQLLEIENKRPIITKNKKGDEHTKYDYASEHTLLELARIQNEKNKTLARTRDQEVHVDLDDYTDINYCAIHMLLKLKGEKRPFELTLMGADVNQLKDLDDKLFKILNGKDVDDRYEPIKKLVKPLTEDGNQESLEKFNKYRSDAMLFQRNKAASSYALQNRPVRFLPMSEDLDPRLDLTDLYNLMVRCDNKAQAAEKKS